MNGGVHKAVGAGVGIAAVAVFRSIEKSKPLGILELAGGAVGGMIGASLPDILEPATSSYHRGPAHSMAFSSGIVYGAIKGLGEIRASLDKKAAELQYKSEKADDWLMSLLYQIGAWAVEFITGALTAVVPGYVSHIALDATTPRGVPIFGFSHAF
jgi:membrane-bound metal-dependent hydrolase YbcI (DUF457 family)